ncbi:MULTISPECIES: protoporphyrinogen oxidase HemJ [unclassified Thalassolituus]|jgi:putative membrane protein|uniref:protoporphyrinogen oxidase HemJ n=1 Tax=unclassified Thalassolituus TaxID=2624967 RepID=UPI000C112B6A|nr:MULTISPECIES: protoporphyrinogen oxidase HemJ [unclassified Thalassolituus]MBN57412.1 TIGR00701 family protein [Oceanospirillaceae bacterium]MDQ4425717.1 protoporphyrinogen oxidase HemJ [Thalassolituus sp.]|tara:strand:- start:9360 stop:9788 length:429 start_codon:yes stop_codon:yes gene_type:complete
MTFLWLKAFHIIAVVTWFAAIFYLPRLFVYHADATDEISRERFKIMERKLYRGIMTPSMVVVIALGLWMLFMNAGFYFSQGWMHAKLTLVALLVVYHFYCGHLLNVFKEDRNTRTHVFYRWFNEVPVFILLGVVILVVVRPF